jgi:hypothetical protein
MDLLDKVIGAVTGLGATTTAIYLGVLAHYARSGCHRCVRRFLPSSTRRLLGLP